MTIAPVAGYGSNNARTNGDMKQLFEDLVSLHKEQIGGATKTPITLASDSFALTNNQHYYVITGEGAVADNLATITGGQDGREIYLRSANAAQIITVKNGTTAGKIKTFDGTDVPLKDGMVMTVRYDAALTYWEQAGIYYGGQLADYRQDLGLGTAALADTGTASANVPTITQADARYFDKVSSNAQNLVVASPSAASGALTARALAGADLPTLPLNKGGLNNTGLTAGSLKLLYGDGTKFAELAAPASGNQFLQSNSGNTALQWASGGNAPDFTSTDQAITSAGPLTIAHGLGVAPTNVWIALVCQTAELGYSVGDVLFHPSLVDNGSSNRGVAVVVDATNLNVRYGAATNPFVVLNKSTGAVATTTNANWKVRFFANR